jgi:hypothetical protein
MNFRLFGCGKFRYLAIEKFDRELNLKEQDFYRKHREVCFECMRYEQQGTNAMNLLHAAAIEPEISENFDERVLSMLRRSRKRVAITYWSPVLAGAAVAGLAIVATLQLISRSPIQPLNKSMSNGAYRYNEDTGSTARNLILPSRAVR